MEIYKLIEKDEQNNEIIFIYSNRISKKRRINIEVS